MSIEKDDEKDGMIIASKIWMLFIKNTDDHSIHHTIHFWRIVAQRTRLSSHGEKSLAKLSGSLRWM